jgi:site-specific DNA recombinase
MGVPVTSASPPRAGLYLRVSTEHQAATGVSLDEQEHRLRAGAAARGWQIVALYRDDGYSGHSMSRPDVQRCVRDVAAGTLDVVYILELERGHRNERDRHNFEHYLADHGVDLIYEAEPQYSRYSQRAAMRGMQGVMAQYYSDYISESTRDKMRYLAQVAKRYPNGRAPFGLRHDADHRLEPDPEWFPWVEQMFQRCAAGEALYAIGRWLAGEGVPTPGELEYRRRPADRRGRAKTGPAAPWDNKAVRRILTNEAFHGVLLYGRRTTDRRTGRELRGEAIRVEDAWPRWIPDDVWYAVQARLASNHVTPRGHSLDNYALSSVRCGICGEAVIGRKRSFHYAPTGRQYVYHKYICGARNRGNGHCMLPIVDAPHLDAAVLAAVAAHLVETSPEARALRQRALELLAERERELRRVVDDLRAEIADVEARRRRALEALTMHQVAISEALLRELDAQVQALSAEVEAARARLAAAETALHEIPVARVRLTNALRDAGALVESLAGQDTAAQRRVLAQIVQTVVLYPGQAHVYLYALADPLIVPTP